MRFLAAITAVSGLVGAAPTVQGAWDTSNVTVSGTNNTVYSFANSCNTYTVHQASGNVLLSAYCRDNTGAWPSRASQINLNHCIANNMGQMEAREDGYFGLSCNRMLFHGAQPILYAFCSNGHYPEETVLDVGNFLDNDDGRLRCFSYYGE
ncbi:hypothetical protein E0Z10_g8422 [Xylaria hypoxylon]|uniref:Cyanovirin-N domain-containing protein n=1 Tax=Xylaria hypoxylon TaxID=37992 RepID=A0A4Z0YV98_9PEZI|nr:hypothetical protein E0Z10_g8422 [Xylaria hypoxylon]